MRKLLLIFIILSLFGINISWAEKGISEMQLKDFTIGEYHLTQPISEIVSKLGQPKKREYNKQLNYEIYYYHKIAFGFYIFEKTIHSIIVEDPELKTFRGVRVGDKKEDIFMKYGKTNLIYNQYYYELWHPSYEWGPYSISFIMKNKRIDKIKIYFAAD